MDAAGDKHHPLCLLPPTPDLSRHSFLRLLLSGTKLSTANAGKVWRCSNDCSEYGFFHSTFTVVKQMRLNWHEDGFDVSNFTYRLSVNFVAKAPFLLVKLCIFT